MKGILLVVLLIIGCILATWKITSNIYFKKGVTVAQEKGEEIISNVVIERLVKGTAFGDSCISKSYKAEYVGEYNIIIGENAGKQLTTESYCVIIAEDSIASNIKGYDFIWYIDYECNFLKDKPELKTYLKTIENFRKQIIIAISKKIQK